MSFESAQLDDFRCILCREFFSPPYNLPYLLTCTHSVCNTCISRTTSQHQKSLICPEDLETNSIADIRSNTTARKALERLVKEHKIFNQNNQLLCIQSLSKHFEHALRSKDREKSDFKQLVQKIIQNQVERLKGVLKHIQTQLEGPLVLVEEWKQMVRDYLSMLKTKDRSRKDQIANELNFYIQQGRRIKTELCQYQSLKFDQISNQIAAHPHICMQSEFSIKDFLIKTEGKQKQKQNKHKNQKIVLSTFPTTHYPLQQIHINDSKVNHLKKKGHQQIMIKRQPEIEKENVCYQDQLATDHTRKRVQQHKKNQPTIITKNSTQLHKNNSKLDISTLKVTHSEQFLSNHQIENRHLNSQGNFVSNQSYECDNKLLIYSPDYEISIERQDQQSDEILLTQKEEKRQWTPANINFLQQWEVSELQHESSLSIRKREPFNWEKQKNAYIKKMQAVKVQEAREQTSCDNYCLQLINHCLSEVEMNLYLPHWNWHTLNTIKFVRTGLTDQQLNDLLNFMLHAQVTTIVLSSNSLTELALDALLNFVKLNAFLKNVYLSKNTINGLRGHTRTKISMLRQHGINLYI